MQTDRANERFVVEYRKTTTRVLRELVRSCDTRYALQVTLDLCFAGWFLPFIDGIRHFKHVAIQLCSHNLLPFILNGHSFTVDLCLHNHGTFSVCCDLFRFSCSCSCVTTISWLLNKFIKRHYTCCSTLLYFPSQYWSLRCGGQIWLCSSPKWSKL